MRILNLYAGIGGSRRHWSDKHEITAVELDPLTARVYQHYFPDDTVVVGDAHQYLLDHFNEFDFIWASPPCPTHSRLNTSLHVQGVIRYPDMSLYQEIIFLKQWHKGKWAIENVIPYYAVLIQPRAEIERHLFWSNFAIPATKFADIGIRIGGNLPSETADMEAKLGIKLPDFVPPRRGRLMLRDITRPEIGAHILKAAMKTTIQTALL